MRTPAELVARRRSLAIYIAKCVTGSLLVQGLASLFGYGDYFWCLISLVLVLTPDSRQAMPLAVLRIKANVCGALAALLCMAPGLLPPVALAIAFALTAAFCFLWDVMDGSRTAMAAVIIILYRAPGAHLWDNAVQRIASVFLGCLLGLIITWTFDRKFLQPKTPEIWM